MMEIRRRGVVLKRIPHRRMRRLFERHGAQTKQRIAAWIAELFPELSHYLPPARKPWMPEHPHMGMFEAIEPSPVASLGSVEQQLFPRSFRLAITVSDAQHFFLAFSSGANLPPKCTAAHLPAAPQNKRRRPKDRHTAYRSSRACTIARTRPSTPLSTR
jgi:hypothetical protein